MNTRKLKAGVGEKTQYLVHEFNDNTIRFVIHYPGFADPELLCEAVRAVVESVDVLHSSFFTDQLRAYWRVNEDYPDTSFFRFVEAEGDPKATAYSLSLLPISPNSETQLCCTLVQGKASSSIVLTMSHLCVDGGDGKYLLNKLVEAYGLLKNTGSAETLEVKNGSRAAEKIYEKINTREFLSLLKNPISSVKSEFPYPTEEPGRVRMVSETIPAAVMEAARKRAKTQNATANDLLLAACYHAYVSLPEIDRLAPVSVMSMMDLRRHCTDGESEGLCNMSGSLPTTLDDGVPENFADTLTQIAAQTNAAKEDPLAGLEGMPLVHGAARTLPMWLLLMISGRVYGSMSIGLTNLGNVSCESLKLGELTPDGGLFGGPLKKKPAMQVSVISFDGACALTIVGQYTETDAASLGKMLRSMVEEIEKYAAE